MRPADKTNDHNESNEQSKEAVVLPALEALVVEYFEKVQSAVYSTFKEFTS